jgi:hypothetical protein
MNAPQQSTASILLRSRAGLVLLAFLAVAAFFLVTEHTAHVLGVLPFLLVLLCPLLHLFLHGRHGSGHAGHGEGQGKRPRGGEHGPLIFTGLLPWPILMGGTGPSGAMDSALQVSPPFS